MGKKNDEEIQEDVVVETVEISKSLLRFLLGWTENAGLPPGASMGEYVELHARVRPLLGLEDNEKAM